MLNTTLLNIYANHKFSYIFVHVTCRCDLGNNFGTRVIQPVSYIYYKRTRARPKVEDISHFIDEIDLQISLGEVSEP